MRILLILILLIAFQTFQTNAQSVLPDRPGFGNGTAIVDGIQLECGIDFSKKKSSEVSSLGQVLVRFPLQPRLELRVAGNSYVMSKAVDGLQDLSVGAKTLILEGGEEFNMLRPRVSLIVETTVPTGKKGIGSDRIQPGASTSIDWPMGGGFGLNVNVFYTSVYDTKRSNQFSGVISVGYAVSDVISSYAEVFSIFPESGGRSRYFGHGWTYLMNPVIQIDLNGGIGLNGDSPDYFIGCGVAVRF